ncbi:MAG: glycoside hydrolase family 3 C-terminal domain-containing protein, partial [Gemmatimonadales bacterium]|nr:glycoside hydrolase family 3 C-terminal domain-containing protein [Gemmatimonadales bacterium]
EAAARALAAGVDVEMASSTYSSLPEAVKAGAIPVATIDSAVRRVLMTKDALGLFDDPYRGVDSATERAAMLTLANRAAARRLAGEAIVLLKNDGVLPLRKNLGSIAVIGPLADDSASVLGSWSAAGRSEDAVTVLAGIRAAVAGTGTRVTHTRGVPMDSIDLRGVPAAERLARSAGAVLLVLGESRNMSGEASSRATLDLPGAQLELARRVIRAARRTRPGKPVAVVLMNGRPLAVPWLADSAPAILESWFLGVEHGHAVADVVFGDANPSGRLPVSVPRAVGQIPVNYARRPTGRPPDSTGHYTSGYIDLDWKPLWPFGHGLSYTTFGYGALRVLADTVRTSDSVAVEIDVTNTGPRRGDETVQLYLRDDVASVAQPVRRLVRFDRIGLDSGETRTVRFVLRPDDLALYDLTLRRVVEPGAFTLYAGGSSTASDSTRFTVLGDTLVLAASPPRFR